MDVMRDPREDGKPSDLRCRSLDTGTPTGEFSRYRPSGSRHNFAAMETEMKGSEKAPSRAVRMLGYAGLVAPVGFTVSAVAQSLRRPDHDLWRDPVSKLAAGDGGWIQDVTFATTGVLLILFGLGLHLVLRPQRHVDPGPGLLGIFGVGLVAAGIFPATDPAGMFVEDRLPHVIAGFVTFASAGLAALAMAPRLRRVPRWSNLASYVRGVGIVLVLLFFAGGILVRPPSAPFHEWLGLFQWVFLAVWYACILVLATRLIRSSVYR